jgi:hypothetical protein
MASHCSSAEYVLVGNRYVVPTTPYRRVINQYYLISGQIEAFHPPPNKVPEEIPPRLQVHAAADHLDVLPGPIMSGSIYQPSWRMGNPGCLLDKRGERG